LGGFFGRDERFFFRVLDYDRVSDVGTPVVL
jgi:hypothetical protein